MSAVDSLRSELESFVSSVTHAPVKILRAEPLAGGASMETWALEMSVGETSHALVMRRDMASNMSDQALTREKEFQLLERVHQQGVRAPRPRWLDDRSRRPYFLMDRLPGESVGRKVVKVPELAHARTVLAAQMGAELAKIHAIEISGVVASLPRPREDQTAARMSLEMIREAMDAMPTPRPVWEFCWRWLSLREPAPSGPLTLLHGDFRIGNLLVDRDGLSGVIDWEFSRIGDPLDDLAWPLLRDWRFENDQLHVGGVGSLDDYLAAYEGAGGRKVDRSALRWWEMAGNLRWAVFCHKQALRHLNGQDRSVELASLARKAAEVEWELLSLIRTTLEAT